MLVYLSYYKVFFYRLFLVYIFYFIARLLFIFYNSDLLSLDSFFDVVTMCYYGIAFDTTAIIYINVLFILCSLFPLVVNTKPAYQKVLIYLYFIPNVMAYATNFIDFIYYRYTFTRSTVATIEVVRYETNKSTLFFQFIKTYWYVFFLFVILVVLWIYLYKKIPVKRVRIVNKGGYFVSSLFAFIVIGTLCVGGIRGDFKKSTRPINMLDANRHTTKAIHADIILNTPFSIIRTWNVTSFSKVHFVDPYIVDSLFQPIKQYKNNPPIRPNVVIFIMESFSREYLGAFNKNSNIVDYVGYTPFLDSLAQHSLIYTNAYANGSKTIHGMSSVLAGIPSFKDAFTSSPYIKQNITSLVSTLKSGGYTTSFFHGAPNGSMGFLGFSNILKFDHYYGKTEFNNDNEFDGFWGIWDEPFFQYMAETITEKKEPFMTTAFSVSSHDPYIVPEKYKNMFPKGTLPIHQCIGYSDYALKRFFETAKTKEWFKNTIFVIVADHCNQVYYDEYKEGVNRFAVPILIYKPDSNLVGVNDEPAQQIDIYPTILSMIGYDKPFRSWGRSLVCDTIIKPFAFNYSGKEYQLMRGNYICTFDGTKATGFYDHKDKMLKYNLISQRNQEMNALEIACKAFIQDYYERIIDKKL